MLEPRAIGGLRGVLGCASRQPSVGSPQPLERGNIPKNATKRPRLAKLVIELEPHELNDNVVKRSRGRTCGPVRKCAEECLDLAQEAIVFPDREREQIAQ